METRVHDRQLPAPEGSGKLRAVAIVVVLLAGPWVAAPAWADYTLVDRWPLYQWTDGSDLTPQGLDVDATRRAFVAFSGRSASGTPAAVVASYGAGGDLVTRWGTAGAGAGQLAFPLDVALDPDPRHIYVADRGSPPRLVKFTVEGAFVWERRGDNLPLARTAEMFSEAYAVDIDASGTIYLLAHDRGSAKVLRFASDGSFVGSWTFKRDDNGSPNARELAVDPEGTAYIVDQDATTATVWKFGPDGEFLTKWGRAAPPGEHPGNGVFRDMSAIEVGPDGLIYVLDHGLEPSTAKQGRVQAFDSSGNHLFTFATRPAQGQASAVTGLAVDPQGALYVAANTGAYELHKYADDDVGGTGGMLAWCSEDLAPPCIAGASRNGEPITQNDPNWGVVLVLDSSNESHALLWNVTRKGASDPFELGPDSVDDLWTVTIDTGEIIPRVSFVRGADALVRRALDGDGTHRVAIAASPTMSIGECDTSSWPWTCPDSATTEREGYLGGDVNDYGVWEDVAQREAMYGLDYATNVAATASPPDLVRDPVTGTEQLQILLASPHFLRDGTTVFRGFAHLRIPAAFLRATYAIDDPASLTSSGVRTEIGGPASGEGTVEVSVEPGGEAVNVDIEGMTFSARRVRIKRGVITPTAPLLVKARRTARTRGELAFEPATPRGSRIVGYRARCTSRRDSVGGRAPARASSIAMSGLRPGTTYRCRVRAVARAGKGERSGGQRLPSSIQESEDS